MEWEPEIYGNLCTLLRIYGLLFMQMALSFSAVISSRVFVINCMITAVDHIQENDGIRLGSFHMRQC
jgi:hypothetical protein